MCVLASALAENWPPGLHGYCHLPFANMLLSEVKDLEDLDDLRLGRKLDMTEWAFCGVMLFCSNDAWYCRCLWNADLILVLQLLPRQLARASWGWQQCWSGSDSWPRGSSFGTRTTMSNQGMQDGPA